MKPGFIYLFALKNNTAIYEAVFVGSPGRLPEVLVWNPLPFIPPQYDLPRFVYASNIDWIQEVIPLTSNLTKHDYDLALGRFPPITLSPRVIV